MRNQCEATKAELREKGQVSTELSEALSEWIGVKGMAAFGSGRLAMEAAIHLAAENAYGSLRGHRVFCPCIADADLVDLVIREGGEPVFVDVSCEDWCMDPEALGMAFDRYPEVRLAIMSYPHGFPGQVGRVKEVCEGHGTLLVEDARGSLGAAAHGRRTGGFGDYGVLDFCDDGPFAGVEGGMLIFGGCGAAGAHAGRPASGVRGAGAWKGIPADGERMGDDAAGLILSRLGHLRGHIGRKKEIYGRYRQHFSDDLMLLNPVGEDAEPNYKALCMTVESNIQFMETRTEWGYEYVSQHGTAAPMQIVDALTAAGFSCEPLPRPLHMRPSYRRYDQVTLDGSKKDYEASRHSPLLERYDESADIYRKGLCLPSDAGMTVEEQERAIEIIFSCYDAREPEKARAYGLNADS